MSVFPSVCAYYTIKVRSENTIPLLEFVAVSARTFREQTYYDAKGDPVVRMEYYGWHEAPVGILLFITAYNMSYNQVDN